MFASGGDGDREGNQGGRTPPPELEALAARRPGGWVYEIDAAWVDDPDGYVPPEAIRGAWKVSGEGRLTGEYRENHRHGPPRHDFSALTEPDHWLDWLGDDPGEAVLTEVVRILCRQIEGTVVEWMKVVETPRFLTGGRPSPEDPGRVVVTRTGLALPFALMARPPRGPRSVVTGVLSWVAVGLDRPGERRDRVWFDIGAGLDRAEEELRSRIYELDRPG
ncbi:hypothetical protein [Actinomadura sp. SCN-SB]|uniref:hypothetical protein n=1 Tax=Actinomadura sp. SCN-SB TaxID=3373092 RepID=UPI0037530A5D